MEIKTILGKTINCEPTQEAIEKEGFDTFKHKLIVNKDKAYLLPLEASSGGLKMFHKDKYKKVNKPSKRCIFSPSGRKWKQYIEDLEYNNRLALLKEKKSNWVMSIEYK